MSEGAPEAKRKAQPPAGTRRFYETAEVAGSAPAFAIHLDGRPVKTPQKNAFALPVRVLAELTAAEWSAQGETVIPANMPLTRLLNSAIDTVRSAGDHIRGEIVSYAASDLLCYRAEGPDGLVGRQNQYWDPPLTWAARDLGAKFIVTVGIIHQEQPQVSLQAISRALEELDDFTLSALHLITTVTGSAVLGLAMVQGELDGDAAWAAAHVDPDWQIELWGHDEEAEEARRHRRLDFDAACAVMDCMKGL